MTKKDLVKKKKKKNNPKWSQIPDYSYRILIIGSAGSGKANSLFNLVNQQPDIDQIYLYAKDPYEAKYQFLIKKTEGTGVKYFNDSKDFLNTQIIWTIFINTLKNTTQIKNIKY